MLCMPADTITAANEAHAAKEKALSEVAALKLAAEKEHAAFEEEWRQLSHIIEDDRCAECSQTNWACASCQAAGQGSSSVVLSIMHIVQPATVLVVVWLSQTLLKLHGMYKVVLVCHVCHVTAAAGACRRAREAARQNEMAERERRTQELLKSCEVSCLLGAAVGCRNAQQCMPTVLSLLLGGTIRAYPARCVQTKCERSDRRVAHFVAMCCAM